MHVTKTTKYTYTEHIGKTVKTMWTILKKSKANIINIKWLCPPTKPINIQMSK